MSIIKEANAIKEQLKEKSIPFPEGFTDLTYEEQVKQGKALLAGEPSSTPIVATPNAATPSEPKEESRGVEMKHMSPEVLTAVLDEIKTMRREMAAKDADLEALRKKFDERATASPLSQYDPNYIKMMREISRPDIKDGMIPMEYANEQDRMEKPVTFFGRKSNIKIWVVQHGGQNILPPNGHDCVRFTNHFWYPNQETGKPNVLCSVTTQSKIMAEYIRLDPRFGVEFFEDVAEAVAISDRSRWADFREQRLMSLRNKPQHEIQALAGQLGIATGIATDYGHILKQIAGKQADQDEAAMKAGEAKMMEKNDPKVLIGLKNMLTPAG